MIQDLGKLTRLKFQNIMKVPYTEEQMGKLWEQMKPFEKINYYKIKGKCIR